MNALNDPNELCRLLFILICLASFGFSQSWKGRFFASDGDTLVAAGNQNGFRVVSYSSMGGGVYGINASLYSVGDALEVIAGRFYADTLGAGAAAKYGIYAHAHGSSAQSGQLFGLYGLAENEGIAASRMFGVFGRSAGCGIGKKYGLYGTATKHRNIACDTLFGVYGEVDPGASVGTSRGIFGLYGKGFGGINDTTFGVYGTGKGGILNYGGWFEPNVFISSDYDTVKLGPAYMKDGMRTTMGGNRTADTVFVGGIAPEWNVQLTWRGPAPAINPIRGICQNGFLVVFFTKADSARARTDGYYYRLTNY